jgi:hypothetical protein
MARLDPEKRKVVRVMAIAGVIVACCPVLLFYVLVSCCWLLFGWVSPCWLVCAAS